MRAGGYTVHQSLTAEAAAVLKLSLGLARRRGHVQVTPLHVAYTLLGSASSCPVTLSAAASTPAYGLLRRACARSSHPAQCRALELCFNVALNRLPTANAVVVGTSPSSSSSSTASSASLVAASFLHQQQPCPTLSNALVAALKRAQASQRRGCVDLQTTTQPPPSSSQQQEPMMLTIRVELDQLIVSILDDPSVSRVMREAGFSSAAVKATLEDESAAMPLHGSSTPSSFLEPFASAYGGGAPSWPAAAQFLSYHYQYQQPDVELEPPPCEEEDVRAIMDVMTRNPQGRRSNPVAVGDTASDAEATAAAAMTRLERGDIDVPGELRGARVVRLRLSRARVRLMTRADVDACVADLRCAAAATTGGGLVIYVGDMRWAVNDDDGDGDAGGFNPAAHLATEIARLLGELRGGRAWLVAAASYGTYMRCQQSSSSSLEATLALQPVTVPAGGGAGGLGLGLALGPRAATRETDGKVAQLARIPLLDFSPKEEDGVPVLCAECARNYEIEASAVRAKAHGTNLALTFFPGWPQADEPQTSHKVRRNGENQKSGTICSEQCCTQDGLCCLLMQDDLMDLKRKWSELCQRVHLQRNHPTHNATTSSNPGLSISFGTSKTKHQDVKTTLSLLPPDSAATSDQVQCHRNEDMDAKQATAQEPDMVVDSRDMKSVLRLWIDELPTSDLKRKAENVRSSSESKRWRGGCGLDLNLCADDEENEDSSSTSSEEELVPSDLTNDGEASGDVVSVTNSLDSHC
ncbi:unnamed protein product [Urochloa decumbens]|uniref:Clp R domain-containing protein n=1 Tax=Urochloa decumbens TaxID=240449 RepID=A0ABC8ZZ83_9POAL